MLTFQVAEVEALKKNLLPFLLISHHADFRFSDSTVSFTAACYHCSSYLYVQLKISEPFFTLLSFTSSNFHSSIQIDDFFLATALTGTNDCLLTFVVPDDHTVTKLIFTTRVGQLRHSSGLEMGPPLNVQVARTGGGGFIAIKADRFRDIATRLSALNTRMWVTATVSEVKFSAIVMDIAVPMEVDNMDIAVPMEENRCWIEGSFPSNGVRFAITLIPLQFFIQASFLDDVVYFYRSIDECTLVTFKTGPWTNIVAYNPHDRWEVL